MEYTTQMDAARKGIFTPEMAKVAEKEHLEPKKLMALMAEGKVIIPCNKVHTCIEPNGLGSMLKTKINVNLGTSRDLTDLNMELEKVNMRSKWARRPLWTSAPSAIRRSSAAS